jgi:D-alanine-D-alanine ligase
MNQLPAAIPVLVLHQEPRAAGDPASAGAESDAGVLAEARAVEAALDRLGYPRRTAVVRTLADVPGAVSAGPERVVFNLVEALRGGVNDFNAVPAVCRSLGRGCTGSDTPALTVTFDKALTKSVLQDAGLPTPPSVVVRPGAHIPANVPLPAIVKPLRADASEGIDARSVVESDRAALAAAVAAVHERFAQPALVERYIEGREINVSLLQRGHGAEALPLAEIEFVDFPPGKPRILAYAAKWLPETFEYRHTVRRVPAGLDDALAEQVRRIAEASWQALGCRDYARVDIRIAAAGHPWVIEVTTNPDIAPDAGFTVALVVAGIPYEEFIRACVHNAWLRAAHVERPPRDATPLPPHEWHIRITKREDRDPVMAILSATEFFRPDEITIAAEVLDAAIEDPGSSGYQSYVYEVDGRVAGWVCFGATPCTVGTFDIYWIAVDPSMQSRGIGARLMKHAEECILLTGGRLVVVETAGRADYDPTRRFYLKIGYHEAARLRDFYAQDDDKVLFLKAL